MRRGRHALPAGLRPECPIRPRDARWRAVHSPAETILLRKAGKLPGKVAKTSYTLEYGKATLEVQKDVIKEGQRVVICDDLLATGGTAKAAAKLIEKIKGEIIGFAFIIELLELNGRDKIKDYRSESLVEY